MRHFVVAAAVTAGGTLAVSAAPWASQTEPSPGIFRAAVDIVQLDVAVFDRQHRPVTGLSAADFEVFEDGKLATIVDFVAIEAAAAVPDAAPWMREVSPDVTTNRQDGHRLIAIVFDDQQMSFNPGVRKLAVKVATAAIDQLGSGDEAAVVFTGFGRGQDFTTDRVALRQAAESLIPHPTGIGQAPERRFGVVENLVEVLRDAPAGRKVLLYIGEAPAFGLARSSRLGLRALMDRFRAANVALYTFDVSGLRTFQRSAGANVRRPASNANAGRVAPPPARTADLGARTGGRDVEGTNDPWDGVPDVFDDTRFYYLIAFERSAPDDGKIHAVEVKVARPDVDVWSRSGYEATRSPVSVASAASPGAFTPGDPIDVALARGLPTGGIPLRVAVTPILAADDQNAVLVVVTGIGAQPGDSQVGSQVTRHVNLVAMALDGNGRMFRTARQTVEVSRTDSAAAPEVISRLEVPPGRYQVRVAVESGGRVGSVFADVDAPDLVGPDLALSGVFLARQQPAPNRPDAAPSDLLPIVPTVGRRFTPAERVIAFVRVYEGGSDEVLPVTMTTTILNERSDRVFQQMLPFAASDFANRRHADVTVEVPLSRLASGEYVLTIEATAGTRSERRDVRFAVE